LSRHFQLYIEHKSSSPCLQEPASGVSLPKVSVFCALKFELLSKLVKMFSSTFQKFPFNAEQIFAVVVVVVVVVSVCVYLEAV
jgi:hypothetical protein